MVLSRSIAIGILLVHGTIQWHNWSWLKCHLDLSSAASLAVCVWSDACYQPCCEETAHVAEPTADPFQLIIFNVQLMIFNLQFQFVVVTHLVESDLDHCVQVEIFIRFWPFSDLNMLCAKKHVVHMVQFGSLWKLFLFFCFKSPRKIQMSKFSNCTLHHGSFYVDYWSQKAWGSKPRGLIPRNPYPEFVSKKAKNTSRSEHL